MIPGDLLSACPHRQFHTLPGLLDSRAALPNSNPNACMPMQGGSLYHFYDGLWYDPAERRTHDLPCERRTRYRLSQPDTVFGRYSNVPRENRLCKYCNLNVVESEYHFLLTCPKYYDLRKKYIRNISWPSLSKFSYLLSSKKRTHIVNISKFINLLMKHSVYEKLTCYCRLSFYVNYIINLICICKITYNIRLTFMHMFLFDSMYIIHLMKMFN